jgi:hypothetical protein
VDLGQQPGPGLSAGERVDLLILRRVGSAGSADAFLPYQLAGARERRAGRDVQGHLGDEVQGGIPALLALEEPRGEEDQVTVSCCSFQRMRCREIGARTMCGVPLE